MTNRIDRAFFEGKRFLVTGASGSIGQQVLVDLLELGAKEIRCVDNNEEQLFLMDGHYADEPRYTSFVADIADSKLMPLLMEDIDYVIHAAALKHVPSCERAPGTAVNTNILGVQNIINSARMANVRKVLLTSSDKAVNPTNVMGTTKLMGERLITAANLVESKRSRTVFFSTRFGNVAGSRGSVIPLFNSQIKDGRDITLTDPNMTRFMMSMKEAVELVLASLVEGEGGEIFITKMPVVRIDDLANYMIDTLPEKYGHKKGDIKIKEIGVRPGEKLFEELMTSEEKNRAYDLGDLFVVLPAHKGIYTNIHYDKYKKLPQPDRAYISDEEEIAEAGILEQLIDDAL